MGGRNGEPFGRKAAAVPHGPARRQRQIIVEQMDETAPEPPPNIRCWNVMPALSHPQSNTGDGLRGAGEPEVMQLDLKSQFPGPTEQADVGFTTQGALKRKGFTTAQALLHLCEQQPRRVKRPGAGLERGEPARDFIGVEEAQALHFRWQKLLRERGLDRAVAARDDVDGGRPGWHDYATNPGVNWPRQPKRLLRVGLTTSNPSRS